MPDWKLHTPNGVSDVLPEECAVKREIEDVIRTVFATCGYRETEPPSFEYYDCYSAETGQISQEKLYKFFDEQGRILALRPDFTTSIARMSATKLAEEKNPQRYMYTGSVYRAESTEGVRRREITQSGIELIGSYAAMADAEVIAATIEAMLALGIEEISMEIGQVAFFNGLVRQLGLDGEMTEKLRDRIDSKDSQGITKIVDGLSINEDIKRLIIDMPYLFGDESVLKRADVKGLNPTSKQALENLKQIHRLLCLYGLEEFISLDLGMLQSIDYYTGSIFKCYTRGVGFPIAAGGRYDELMSMFGTPKGAVGCAIGINRIMEVYSSSVDAFPSTLVYAERNAEGLAYDLASDLRINGCLTELYIGGGAIGDALAYASETGSVCVMKVSANGGLVIYDLERDDIIETTVDDFRGARDDTPELSPQDMGFRKL